MSPSLHIYAPTNIFMYAYVWETVVCKGYARFYASGSAYVLVFSSSGGGN